MEVRRAIYKEDKLRRKNKFSLLLNNREMRAIGIYCSRYRVKNKSEFMRTAIMREIIKRFNDEHPTLWEDAEPTLFNQKIG